MKISHKFSPYKQEEAASRHRYPDAAFRFFKIAASNGFESKPKIRQYPLILKIA